MPPCAWHICVAVFAFGVPGLHVLPEYVPPLAWQIFADRSRIVLERYRLLVELEDGVRCGPPVYGPAAGALLEAYAAGGLHPTLSNLPEFKA